MDLSVQKMQPPATVRGKSAAKKTSPGSESDEAVANTSRDQAVEFKHGNTGYDALDPDERKPEEDKKQKRQDRRKNRELLSQDDLSELTASMENIQKNETIADGLMHVKAYQTAPHPKEEEKDLPHFEVNI
ncbi:hypothetical protein [uncultured Cohaesibacter sp.]|uniref:hypothetical protein n=1 Tax=uncultured Cohaesibacter sp. TaxID=1002546 RepID=UPI0029C901E1|nr:hypothetical protein [uncultured Cohaesibacter sp.]